MTAREMILLCSSLQGVRTCILCVWFWVLPPLQLLEHWVTPPPHLRLEACRSMPQHSIFFWGAVGACSARHMRSAQATRLRLCCLPVYIGASRLHGQHSHSRHVIFCLCYYCAP